MPRSFWSLGPPQGQGKSEVLGSCQDEELENWYSPCPGVTVVFILGSPRMWVPGGTYFPVLVMAGSTRYWGPGPQLPVMGGLVPLQV